MKSKTFVKCIKTPRLVCLRVDLNLPNIEWKTGLSSFINIMKKIMKNISRLGCKQPQIHVCLS